MMLILGDSYELLLESVPDLHLLLALGQGLKFILPEAAVSSGVWFGGWP